jgi:hypothetical protein
VVRTAELDVRDLGTMFCVAASENRSTVSVTDGRVWVESRETGAGLELGSGDTIRSDDLTLATRPLPPTLTVGEPALPAARPRNAMAGQCSGLPTTEKQRACYAAASLKEDFGAQNALYSLALLDSDRPDRHDLALRELRLYQSRYPHGHLGPEVSLALIRLLAGRGPEGEVIDEASRFLTAYPDHPKVYEVALVRANSLLRLGRRTEAHNGYEALLQVNAPSDIASAARRGALETLPAPGPTQQNTHQGHL